MKIEELYNRLYLLHEAETKLRAELRSLVAQLAENSHNQYKLLDCIEPGQLKQLRGDVKQIHFAKDANVPQSTVSELEASRPRASMEVILKLLQLYVAKEVQL